MYQIAIGDDIDVLNDPNRTPEELANALKSLSLNFVPFGSVEAKIGLKLEQKLTLKVVTNLEKSATKQFIKTETKAASITAKSINNSLDKAETFYRTMSKADYDTFVKTGKMPATSETFLSPTQSFSEGYNGVTVEFKVNSGTTNSLEAIGVRDTGNLTKKVYSDMPTVQKGWASNNAYFKTEDNQINIGLGNGKALDIFNDNIIEHKIISGR